MNLQEILRKITDAAKEAEELKKDRYVLVVSYSLMNHISSMKDADIMLLPDRMGVILSGITIYSASIQKDRVLKMTQKVYDELVKDGAF